MNERWYLSALLAAIVLAAQVASPLLAAEGGDVQKTRKCSPENRLEWQPTKTPGVDRIRDASFTYTLEEAAIERLVDLSYERLPRKREKESSRSAKTVDATQGGSVRERIRAEIGTLARRTVCFDAYRIDPKQATLELISAVSEINGREGVEGGVRRIEIDGKTGYLPVYYDLDTLLTDAPGFTDGLVGVFNAGWSSGIAQPAPIGFLKLGGTVVNESFYPGLSAILCLTQNDGRTAGARYFYAQKTGKFAFENWHDQPADDWARQYRAEFDRCGDAVQVGPRIVEFDNSEFLREYADEFDCMKDLAEALSGFETKVGICESSVMRTPRRRTILASDLGNAMNFDQSGALYLIVTHNQVALYDLQMLLLTTGLVGDKENLWAINLAGDSQIFWASLGIADRLTFDNPWTAVHSAITLRRAEGNR